MGVPGLSSFVEEHPDLLVDHQLRDTKLIIDGSNLYHFIYFRQNVILTYGGEYSVFAKRIRRVSGVLRACGIKPYVVFDGAYTRDETKLDTVIKRARKKILSSDAVSRGKHGQVLPLLAYDTFVHVLNELNIPHMTCDQESDDQIVLLANEYNCPVLSDDGDFYIFDVHGGYIRIENLSFETRTSSEGGHPFLPCRLYHMDHMMMSFKGLMRNNLPLVVIAQGNDVIAPYFGKFLAQLKMPRDRGNCPTNPKYNKLVKLLHWLASLDNPENAQEEIVKFLGPSQERKMREAMQLSVDGYRNMTSDFDLRDFFEKKGSSGGPTRLKGYNDTEIPHWLMAKVRKAELPVLPLNILTLHQTFLHCQVEHTESPSAWACTDRLRAILYGILLKEDLEAAGCSHNIGDNRSETVEEYNRNIRMCDKSFLDPCLEVPGFGPVPGLTDLPTLDKDVRERLFFQSLSVEKTALSTLAPTLTMYIACIIMWIKESKASYHYVKSLLICMISHYVSYHADKRRPTSGMTDAPSGLDLKSAFRSTSVQQIRNIRNNLSRFYKPPPRRKIVDTRVVYGFAQFQACLSMAKYLNKLLGDPIVDANPGHLFSGVFCYNVCRSLMHRPSPDLSEMLIKESPLERFFQGLDNFILSNLGPDEAALQRPKSRTRREKSGKHQPKQPTATGDEGGASGGAAV